MLHLVRIKQVMIRIPRLLGMMEDYALTSKVTPIRSTAKQLDPTPPNSSKQAR